MPFSSPKVYIDVLGEEIVVVVRFVLRVFCWERDFLVDLFTVLALDSVSSHRVAGDVGSCHLEEEEFIVSVI